MYQTHRPPREELHAYSLKINSSIRRPSIHSRRQAPKTTPSHLPTRETNPLKTIPQEAQPNRMPPRNLQSIDINPPHPGRNPKPHDAHDMTMDSSPKKRTTPKALSSLTCLLFLVAETSSHRRYTRLVKSWDDRIVPVTPSLSCRQQSLASLARTSFTRDLGHPASAQSENICRRLT